MMNVQSLAGRFWGRIVRPLSAAFGLIKNGRLTYFVSHAYDDSELLDSLKGKLWWWMHPVIFPATQVPVDQLVSNPILQRIRECHGLIFLETPKSRASFWVSMERDYAIRQGKPVYALDPTLSRLHRWRGSPLAPAIYTANSAKNSELVRQIVEIMDRRYIAVETSVRPPESLNWDEHPIARFHRLMSEGGYTILFWSAEAQASKLVSAELDMAMKEFPAQVLIAKIDETSLPEALASLHTVSLMQEGTLSQYNRIDDLIVRLYWLVSGNLMTSKQ
jgi:hypothetical protein